MSDNIEKLVKLADLLDKGLISRSQFDRERDRLLGISEAPLDTSDKSGPDTSLSEAQPPLENEKIKRFIAPSEQTTAIDEAPSKEEIVPDFSAALEPEEDATALMNRVEMSKRQQGFETPATTKPSRSFFDVDNSDDQNQSMPSTHVSNADEQVVSKASESISKNSDPTQKTSLAFGHTNAQQTEEATRDPEMESDPIKDHASSIEIPVEAKDQKSSFFDADTHPTPVQPKPTFFSPAKEETKRNFFNPPPAPAEPKRSSFFEYPEDEKEGQPNFQTTNAIEEEPIEEQRLSFFEDSENKKGNDALNLSSDEVNEPPKETSRSSFFDYSDDEESEEQSLTSGIGVAEVRPGEEQRASLFDHTPVDNDVSPSQNPEISQQGSQGITARLSTESTQPIKQSSTPSFFDADEDSSSEVIDPSPIAETPPYTEPPIRSQTTKKPISETEKAIQTDKRPQPIKAVKEVTGYQVGERLNEIRIGSVFDGIDENGKAVDILFIDDRYASDFILELLVQEAINLAPHPCLLNTRQWIKSESGPALITDKPKGISLRQKVEAQTKLHWDGLLPAIMQAADGLSCAYKQGSLHLHLSPDVIYHDEKSGIQIQGMGIPQFLSKDDLKPCDFLAPEQHKDPSVRSQQVDVYSFGLTLLYCLTGRLPWPPKTATLEIESVKNRGINPGTGHPAADRILATCLQADPNLRFASITELAEELLSEIESFRLPELPEVKLEPPAFELPPPIETQEPKSTPETIKNDPETSLNESSRLPNISFRQRAEHTASQHFSKTSFFEQEDDETSEELEAAAIDLTAPPKIQLGPAVPVVEQPSFTYDDSEEESEEIIEAQVKPDRTAKIVPVALEQPTISTTPKISLNAQTQIQPLPTVNAEEMAQKPTSRVPTAKVEVSNSSFFAFDDADHSVEYTDDEVTKEEEGAYLASAKALPKFKAKPTPINKKPTLVKMTMRLNLLIIALLASLGLMVLSKKEVGQEVQITVVGNESRIQRVLLDKRQASLLESSVYQIKNVKPGPELTLSLKLAGCPVQTTKHEILQSKEPQKIEAVATCDGKRNVKLSVINLGEKELSHIELRKETQFAEAGLPMTFKSVPVDEHYVRVFIKGCYPYEDNLSVKPGDGTAVLELDAKCKPLKKVPQPTNDTQADPEAADKSK